MTIRIETVTQPETVKNKPIISVDIRDKTKWPKTADEFFKLDKDTQNACPI